jgi:hypothetical protein
MLSFLPQRPSRLVLNRWLLLLLLPLHSLLLLLTHSLLLLLPPSLMLLLLLGWIGG